MACPHGRVERDAAKAWQARDHRRERWQARELLDLAIQLVTPLQFVHEERVVLPKHEPIVRGERRAVRRQVLQPLQMGRAPVGAVAKDEAAAGEEYENVVARLEDLALERFPAAHDVADPLIGLARNPDGNCRRTPKFPQV